MSKQNFSIDQRPVFLFAIILASIFVVGFFPSIVDAAHPPENDSVSKSLVAGSNIVSFRDITNIMEQSSAVSVDSSTIKAGFITIIVEEKDANLDSTGIDVVLSSATSTSSGLEKVTIELTETGVNSGTFTGPLTVTPFGPTTDSTLELGPGDDISVFYDPEPDGVGRFNLDVDVTSGTADVEISDYIFDETRLFDTCAVGGFDIYTQPVNVAVTGSPTIGDTTITLSFVNAVDPPGFDKLDILYRPIPTAADPTPDFTSLGGGAVFPPPFTTIKSTINPPELEGQYAIGASVGCIGGGGGGLVRPGLVVNTLVGSGSVLGLFTGGSGGGAKPTFGDASLLVLENIAEGFGGTISEGDDISLDSTKVVNTGDTVVMRFNLAENQGINNLERFRMFLNFEGENYDASIIDTHITYERGGVITIVDPHEKIENAEIEILTEDPWNLIVNVQIIFKNPFNTSILVDSWDLDRNSGKKLFPDVLQVEEPSVLLADTQIEFETSESILTTTEDMTETKLTEIPVWVKSNALWWKQKQIDDSDFMAGIKYLVQKTIIEIDESELSTSATSSEIPVWIRDVAGMWADYSITDEEFVNAMKWLLSNGILEVQQ